MAYERLFSALGRELVRKADEARRKAAQAFGLTIELTQSGDLVGAQEAARDANNLLNSSLKHQKDQALLVEELLPKFKEMMAGVDLEDLPVEFLETLASGIDTPIPPVTEEPEVTDKSTRGKVSKAESGRHSLDLTENQYLDSRVCLRLHDEEPEGKTISIEEAVWKLLPEDRIKSAKSMDVLIASVFSNFKGAKQKLVEVETRIPLMNKEKVTLPLNEDQLKALSEFKNLQDIYQRLGNKQEYQGMTIKEVLEAKKPRAKQAKDQSTHEGESNPSLQPFTTGEIGYLTQHLLGTKGESLSEEDRIALEKLAVHLPAQSDLDLDKIRNSLEQKLKLYSTLSQEEQIAFFDTPSQSGTADATQLILGILYMIKEDDQELAALV